MIIPAITWIITLIMILKPPPMIPRHNPSILVAAFGGAVLDLGGAFVPGGAGADPGAGVADPGAGAAAGGSKLTVG